MDQRTKSSDRLSAATGEIHDEGASDFEPTDMMTTVKLDPELVASIARNEARVTEGFHAARTAVGPEQLDRFSGKRPLQEADVVTHEQSGATYDSFRPVENATSWINAPTARDTPPPSQGPDSGIPDRMSPFDFETVSGHAARYALDTEPVRGEFPNAYEARRMGKGIRIVAVMSVLFMLFAALFVVFILARNGWQFDASHVDQMVLRAFGARIDDSAVGETPRSELRLESTHVALHVLADRSRVVVVRGKVTNSGLRYRRHVFVTATVRRAGRAVGSAEAPIDNVFELEEISHLSVEEIASKMNPDGQNGKNRRIDPGSVVDFMVLISNVPDGYDAARDRITIRATRASFGS